MYYFSYYLPCSLTICNTALMLLQNKALGIRNSLVQNPGFPKNALLHWVFTNRVTYGAA